MQHDMDDLTHHGLKVDEILLKVSSETGAPHSFHLKGAYCTPMFPASIELVTLPQSRDMLCGNCKGSLRFNVPEGEFESLWPKSMRISEWMQTLSAYPVSRSLEHFRTFYEYYHRVKRHIVDFMEGPNFNLHDIEQTPFGDWFDLQEEKAETMLDLWLDFIKKDQAAILKEWFEIPEHLLLPEPSIDKSDTWALIDLGQVEEFRSYREPLFVAAIASFPGKYGTVLSAPLFVALGLRLKLNPAMSYLPLTAPPSDKVLETFQVLYRSREGKSNLGSQSGLGRNSSVMSEVFDSALALEE